MATYFFQEDRDLTHIGTALTAEYGAGNVTIHSSAASKLIFTATPINDKPIKIYVSGSQLFAAYGSAYDSGTDDITDPQEFCGSSSTGTGTGYHLYLTENLMTMNWFTTGANSKLVMVGKLTNDAYGVIGLCGSSSATYYVNHFGFFTADGADLWFVLRSLPDQATATGKVMTVPAAVFKTGDVLLTAGGDFVTFKETYVATRQTGQTTAYKGTDYFFTTSGNYRSDGQVISNSILVTE